MRRLLRTILLLVMAASYVTLAWVRPQMATILAVWLPYAVAAGCLAICNLRAAGHHGR